MNWSNIGLTRVPEAEERKDRKEVMAEIFPNLIKSTNS